jgi:hypothetical protein
VGKTIINHPPVITIFIGGMVTIPKFGWFMALFFFPDINWDRENRYQTDVGLYSNQLYVAINYSHMAFMHVCIALPTLIIIWHPLTIINHHKPYFGKPLCLHCKPTYLTKAAP